MFQIQHTNNLCTRIYCILVYKPSNTTNHHECTQLEHMVNAWGEAWWKWILIIIIRATHVYLIAFVNNKAVHKLVCI